MTTAPNRGRNSFAHKILPLADCSSRIFSRFLPNAMIPIDREGRRGTPKSCTFPFREFAFFLASLAFAVLFSTALASAQAQRGTLVHEETIRVAPSSDAAKLGEAGRCPELVLIDSSRVWVHVEAILRAPRRQSDEEEEDQGKPITGWIPAKA